MINSIEKQFHHHFLDVALIEKPTKCFVVAVVVVVLFTFILLLLFFFVVSRIDKLTILLK